MAEKRKDNCNCICFFSEEKFTLASLNTSSTDPLQQCSEMGSGLLQWTLPKKEKSKFCSYLVLRSDGSVV